MTSSASGRSEPIDATYLFLGTVGVPIVVIQVSRILPWHGGLWLVLAAAIGLLGLAAEGRHRGHGNAVVGMTAACAVVLGSVWMYVLGITRLLLQSPIS